MKRVLAAIVLLGLALLTVSLAGGADRGPFVISHCQWRTGAGCPAAPRHCHLKTGGVQDPTCTPGALNPAVSQQTIASTICRSGYSARIRPPSSYTEPLKFQSMRAYGLGSETSDYEFDHLISLELGGAPSDIRNLWPESNQAPSYSFRKDGLENSLNAAVCSGAISLAAAQRRIGNWVHFVSPPGGGNSAPTPPPNPDGRCDPAYPTVCIAPPPPDLDCDEIPYRNFKVLPPDPQHLDADGDGVGCETG